MPTELPDFEGLPCVVSSVALRNAGDGLSAAMKVEPVVLHKGDVVDVLTRCVVIDVQHPPVDRDKPEGPCARKHILRAGTSTIIDLDVANEAIKDQAEKIRLWEEEQAGIQALNFEQSGEGGEDPDAHDPDDYLDPDAAPDA
jgi:hypothetical protein